MNFPIWKGPANKAGQTFVEWLQRKVSIGYPTYKVYLRSFNRPVVGCLLIETKESESLEELLFLIHQLYREYQLTSPRRDIIGYPSSLNFQTAYPAVYLHRELAYIASNYLDRGYTLSLAQNTARERMTRVLDDEYLGILFDGEISGASAYVVMIALACTCGARFEAFVYRTCLSILVQEIGQLEISPEWIVAQTNSLVRTTSCLLNSAESTQEYEASLEEFFSSNKADDGYSAAAICLGTLQHYLEERL